MKENPDLTVQMPENPSLPAERDKSSLEPHQSKDECVSLDEQSKVEETGPVEFKCTGTELLKANIDLKWNLSLKQRYKRFVAIHRGRPKYTNPS